MCGCEKVSGVRLTVLGSSRLSASGADSDSERFSVTRIVNDPAAAAVRRESVHWSMLNVQLSSTLLTAFTRLPLTTTSREVVGVNTACGVLQLHIALRPTAHTTHQLTCTPALPLPPVGPCTSRLSGVY